MRERVGDEKLIIISVTVRGINDHINHITTPAPPPHSVFYRPDALPAAKPTASKHIGEQSDKTDERVLRTSLYVILKRKVVCTRSRVVHGSNPTRPSLRVCVCVCVCMCAERPDLRCYLEPTWNQSVRAVRLGWRRRGQCLSSRGRNFSW